MNEKERTRNYYLKNREEIRHKQKQYREKNKEYIKNLRRKHYFKNKDNILNESKRWREHNKQYVKEHNKQRYEANKHELNEYNKQYREANKEEIKAQRNQYYKANKEEILNKCKQYKKANKHKRKENYNKKMLDPNFKIEKNLRNRIKHALKGNSKSDSTIKLLGCSGQEYKEHLEKQFTFGMNWKNYGLYGWHVDHMKPCKSFDLSKEQEQKKCFNYTNQQPLWASANLKKGSNII